MLATGRRVRIDDRMASVEGEASTLITDARAAAAVTRPAAVPALVVLWSRSEPHRVGEVVVPVDGAPQVLGRRDGAHTLALRRQRPGATTITGPLETRAVSREQWRLEVRRGGLAIENVGRRELLHNGVPASQAVARRGDLLEMRDELLMMVVSRPAELAPERLPDALVPAFGTPDAFGIVGESTAAWDLRRQLAFAAGRDDHVLITGASGTGKELAAGAIHGLSRRAGARLVARNAATLPDGIVDAELFGNSRDYPHAGMPERPGLVGAADGSTLFLDEIGEVSHTLQAHLLRVIDSGEYHRLGEARGRRADVRVVAATNRDPATLKHDLVARLRLRVRLPGLDRRREDIPLITRHLLRTLAREDRLIADRAFPDGDVTGEPRWTAAFVAALVSASYPTNVRDLQTRLWDALAVGSGPLWFGAPGGLEDEDADADEDTDVHADVDPAAMTADQVLAALAAADGSRERAWRSLGLRSRHQLLRVMRRLGLGTGPR
jgi:hypothetical protein